MENENVTPYDDKIILSERKVIGVRRKIGQKMAESLSKSPQATLTTEADMYALAALKESYLNRGIKVSYTDIFVKLTACALQLHPILNSSLQDGKIIQYKSINIGVAVGTDEALFVPVIKNVQDKNIEEISSELNELVRKIKDKETTPDDFMGGTFTISNIGIYKIDYSTPIINAPEAAILAIGCTRKRLIVEDDDSIKIKPVVTLSLTIDHAVMDGLPAAKFMESILSIMKDPIKYF